MPRGRVRLCGVITPKVREMPASKISPAPATHTTMNLLRFGNRKRHTVCTLCCAVFLSLAAGCSSSDGPTLSPVEGDLTLDGKPISNAIVRFLPDHDAGTVGPMASAVVDENGHYELMSPGERPGAVPGRHLVTVICRELPVREVSEGVFEESDEECLVPGKYASETTSGIQVTVEDGPTTIDIKLSSTDGE